MAVAKEMTSFRMEPELVAALRALATERGETLSEVMRKGALLVLGYCPTCHRKIEPEESP